MMELGTYLGSEFSRGLGHDLYFAGVLAIGGLVFWLDRESRDLSRRILFVSFFFVFALLQVSPVVASRFSPFFLLPLLLGLDLGPLRALPRLGAPVHLLLPLAVGALFVADFLGVLVKGG